MSVIRKLGEDHVSLLGLGTVKLGRNQQVKYPQSFSIPEDKAVKKLLDTALDLGINLIDTAPAYGHSEERLGTLLPDKRDRWHIVTKVGEEFEQGQSYFDFSEKHIRFSIERSLKRLRTDYLDTVLVHSNGCDEELIRLYGVLDILKEIKKQGWIRYIGMSTKTIEGGLLALENSDVVMATFNLNYKEEQVILEQAARLDKSILIKKALGSGHLYDATNIKKTFQEIASFSAVSSIVIGTMSPDHLSDNFEKMRLALEKS